MRLGGSSRLRGRGCGGGYPPPAKVSWGGTGRAGQARRRGLSVSLREVAAEQQCGTEAETSRVRGGPGVLPPEDTVPVVPRLVGNAFVGCVAGSGRPRQSSALRPTRKAEISS